MQSRQLAIGLSLLNALLLIGLIATNVRSLSATQDVLPVLRGHSLEIVDDAGRLRASIRVRGPETVDGREYPGAVVLVMGDPRGAPGVKLAASANGAGLGLSNGVRLPNGRSSGIEFHADDPIVTLTDKQGRQLTLKPER